jgi:Domain of unknown function (DUF5050)
MQRNIGSRHKLQTEAKLQNGFILLPVVLTITLIAAIVFLMNREVVMAVNELGGEMQSTQASMAAKAGINHMLWQANNANCTGYTNLAATNIGNNSYSATITPTSNSPVTIKATGTDAQGASYTVTRDRVTIYQPYKTVTLQLGTDAGMDAAIASAYSTTNFGADENAVLKTWLFNWYYRDQLIQFDLPGTIPINAHIVSAELQLFQKTGFGSGEITAHRVTQPWDEGTKTGSGTADGATWKTYDGTNAWATNGGDYDSIPVATSEIKNVSGVVASWEIAPLVKYWLSDKTKNFGVLLKTNDTISPTFGSKEDPTSSKRPKLIITYTCECSKVCAPAKKLYWTDDTANKIQMSDEDGSNVEDLITALDRPTGLDVDTVHKKLYWTNNLQIMRSNLDGTNQETIYTGTLVTMDIKLDVAGDKIYWTHDNPTSRVMRANLDGSNSQTINTTLNRPAYLSLNISAGHIYTTNVGNGSIARMNLDGTSVTNLISGQGSSIGSAIDPVNGKLYWSAGSTGDWLKRSNLDGSSIQTIVTVLNSPQDITFDSDTNRIYWAENTGKRIQRANPDGSNKVAIVSSGLTSPRSVSLVNTSLIGKNRARTLIPVADVDIYEGDPSTPYGKPPNEKEIVAGRDSNGKQDKILIKFDLSSLPTGATITSATLRLNLINTLPLGSTASYNIGLYKIIKSWLETTATWSNFSSGGNYDSTRQAVTSVALGTKGFKEWTVPVAVINGWISTPSSNYGLALVYESSTKGPDYQFASKENMTVANRPQLVINYTLP